MRAPAGSYWYTGDRTTGAERYLNDGCTDSPDACQCAQTGDMPALGAIMVCVLRAPAVVTSIKVRPAAAAGAFAPDGCGRVRWARAGARRVEGGPGPAGAPRPRRLRRKSARLAVSSALSP